MSSSIPVLGYYRLRGWVGSIRLILAYLEIPYEEKLYENPTPNNPQGNWISDKYSLKLDFPNIPYWIDEHRNERLTETKAILKHISRRYKSSLLGTSELEQSRANMLEEIIWDMWNDFCKTCLAFTESLKDTFKAEAPKKLTLLSNILISNVYLLGNEIRFVDFLAYEILYHYAKMLPDLRKQFPNLKNYLATIESIPQIQKYMQSPDFIEGPCYGYKFKAKI